MILEIFLICALALPPITVPPIKPTKEFNILVDFLRNEMPGRQIVFVQDMELPVTHYDRFFVEFMGYRIYIKKSA